MRLPGILGSYSLPSEYVFTVRNWLQMGGIDAMLDPAEVIERQTLWNFTDEQPVRKLVSDDAFSVVAPELAVTTPVFGSLPQPTGFRFFNSRPEASDIDLFENHHSS